MPQNLMPPTFGYLVRLGLESVGIHYVSIDLLRKSKKNETTEREYWTLWRLLHDLVLVVLADFEVDIQAMKQMNDVESLESALLDPELHLIHMEIAQVYLYKWGFVCTAFYTEMMQSPEGRPSSQVLLLAIAWLLAFSRFFERQHRDILERCTGSKQLRLPPFPNDVDLDTDSVLKAAHDAVINSMVPHENRLSLDGKLHQLHSAFGRLLGHLNELKSYARYHERLVTRLELIQNKSEEFQDELIPAYVLNLVVGSTTRLADQVKVLSQSLQMTKDETLFYKWINGLVLSLKSGSDLDSQASSVTTADTCKTFHSTLNAQIQEVQAVFQVHSVSFQQIEQGYKRELEKWISRQKSRTRVQQMETKVERFTHEVQFQELFDPQKLFLDSQRSWEALDVSHGRNCAKQMHLATSEEVDLLQSQVASVISEITQSYCGLQLR